MCFIDEMVDREKEKKYNKNKKPLKETNPVLDCVSCCCRHSQRNNSSTIMALIDWYTYILNSFQYVYATVAHCDFHHTPVSTRI